VNEDRPRLGALSGLRLFAIAYIVWYHVGAAALENGPQVVDRFRRQANVFMPLFFVLSGFVLTYRYLEPIKSGTLGARAFWVSRLLRLWPIYLVALALYEGVHAFELRGLSGYYLAGAISQALMVQSFTPPLVWYGNAPGWTVSVEVFCYLLFPWLVVRMARLRLRRAFALVTALWLGGQLVSLTYVVVSPEGWPPGGEPSPILYDLLRFLPPLHLPSFLAGMLAARVFVADRERGQNRAAGLMALAALVPIVFALGDGVRFIGRHAIPVLVHSVPFTRNGLLTPAWALLVFGLAHGGAPRWLSARPIVRLGDASYGLYILHVPVFRAVATFLVEDWDKKPLFLLQFFALMLPLSLLSFERFEQPLRNALLRRLSPARHHFGITGP
jgi:peptidoglycan/LPS O-acetylase OafA/YrhL